jgi:hypothetical protein
LRRGSQRWSVWVSHKLCFFFVWGVFAQSSAKFSAEVRRVDNVGVSQIAFFLRCHFISFLWAAVLCEPVFLTKFDGFYEVANGYLHRFHVSLSCHVLIVGLQGVLWRCEGFVMCCFVPERLYLKLLICLRLAAYPHLPGTARGAIGDRVAN